MNTTSKGDAFENKAYTLIKDALATGKLGLIDSQCKIYSKKGYYSRDREKNIIFDLTIELWLPNSNNYSLLFIIECKNYNHRVPVDDVEEFYSKIDQVSGANRKGIFITNNSFQQGAYNYAKNKGIMLIEVLSDDSLNIILHRSSKTSNNTVISRPVIKIQEHILNAFIKNEKSEKIEGLDILSKKDIESITLDVLTAFDQNILEQSSYIDLESLKFFLNAEYSLSFGTAETFKNNDELLGLYDNKEKRIVIKDEILDTRRYPFILAHEIGHYFLHSNLKINQSIYNNFTDSKYNFLLNKHELKNPKQWIEWQANYFASCLLMPKIIVLKHLLSFQIKEGVRNKGQVFLDNQKVNIALFYQTIDYLSKKLRVSNKNVIYRMRDLGIILLAKNTSLTKYLI